MGKLAGVVLLALVAPASAETLNINFGAPGTGPSPTYAAAGKAGTWNTITGVAGNNFQLVTIDGAASNVTMTQSPTTTMLTGADPALSGDDAKLLDTGLVTTGAETCLSFNNMKPGEYEVIVYAWTPNAPTVMSRTRQDEAPTTKDIGGAWTGAHVEGVTYARYRVTVDASGILPAHSGLAPSQPKAAVNAVQIREIPRSTPDSLGQADDAVLDGQDDPDMMDDPKGDAGCSAGGAGGPGGAVLVALGLVGIRRRVRSRRA